MAEGDAVLFNNYKEQLLLGDFNLSSNTIKVALVSGVTPDRDTHDYWDDPAPRSRLAGADPNQARRAQGGHYQRNLLTPAGNIERLEVPSDREGEFVTGLFERYKRMTGDVEEAVLEMYLSGISG